MGSEVEGKRQRKEKRGGKGRRRREGTPDIRIRDSVTEEIQSAFLSSLLPFLLPPSPLLPRDLLLFPEKRRRENTKEPASSLLLPVSLLIREHARTHVCMCCSQGQDAVITVQTIKEEGKTKGGRGGLFCPLLFLSLCLLPRSATFFLPTQCLSRRRDLFPSM